MTWTISTDRRSRCDVALPILLRLRVNAKVLMVLDRERHITSRSKMVFARLKHETCHSLLVGLLLPTLVQTRRQGALPWHILCDPIVLCMMYGDNTNQNIMQQWRTLATSTPIFDDEH